MMYYNDLRDLRVIKISVQHRILLTSQLEFVFHWKKKKIIHTHTHTHVCVCICIIPYTRIQIYINICNKYMHVFIHTHIHILQNLKTYENFKDLRTVWSATEKQKGATEPPMLCLASWRGSAVPGRRPSAPAFLNEQKGL